VSKTQSGIQELDETLYWLELLVERGIVKQAKLLPLMGEAEELPAMLVASVKTAKRQGV